MRASWFDCLTNVFFLLMFYDIVQLDASKVHPRRDMVGLSLDKIVVNGDENFFEKRSLVVCEWRARRIVQRYGKIPRALMSRISREAIYHSVIYRNPSSYP